MIDYTKFAIFVRESELPLLEGLLDSFTLPQLEEMQLALKIVRYSFLYLKQLLKRYGPVDLIMRNLILKRNLVDPQLFYEGRYMVEGDMLENDRDIKDRWSPSRNWTTQPPLRVKQ